MFNLLIEYADSDPGGNITQAISDGEIDLDARNDPDEWNVYLMGAPKNKVRRKKYDMDPADVRELGRLLPAARWGLRGFGGLHGCRKRAVFFDPAWR